MNNILKVVSGRKEIFMGIDIHEHTYRVSMFFEGEEIVNTEYRSDVRYLKGLLERYRGFLIHGVYEAGAFGYTLCDWLRGEGVEAIVTSPSRVPVVVGERVKTDKRDARRLAHLLSCGLLRGVCVPEKRKREDRDLLRTRDQLVSQRRRIFQQIQSKLRFHGIAIRNREFISRKKRELILGYSGMGASLRKSFEYLLNSYDYYTELLKDIRKDILAISEGDAYRRGVEILSEIPGVGILTALSFILELPDMSKFEKNEQVGSYLGLTASEYSSGDKQRQGHITRCGNSRVRWMLIQSAWKLIEGDGAMRRFYERVKRRRGGKRAIVAVARKLSGRMRTILLRNEPYELGLLQ